MSLKRGKKLTILQWAKLFYKIPVKVRWGWESPGWRCVSVLGSWWAWQDRGSWTLILGKLQPLKRKFYSTTAFGFHAVLFELKTGNRSIKCLLFLGWLLEWIWKICAFLRSANQQWQRILREPDHCSDYHSGKYGEKMGGLSIQQDFCFLESIIQPVEKTSNSSHENLQ